MYNPISTSKASHQYPSDCKPNINDLRQLFDSSKYEYKRNFNSQIQQTSSYADAKQSAIDENVLESKIGLQSRNIDFERAKQKFDKPTSLRLTKCHQVKQSRYNNSSSKRGDVNSVVDLPNTKIGKHSNEMGGGVVEQLYENNVRTNRSKKDYIMTTSMNLDELKVSEDDDVSIN